MVQISPVHEMQAGVLPATASRIDGSIDVAEHTPAKNYVIGGSAFSMLPVAAAQ